MTGVVTRATKGVPLTATDHDNNLEVTVSLHKSATEPSPTYACMLWADTDNDLLKMRNKANDAWITMGALDTTGAFSDNNLADQDQLSELSDVTITSVADNEVLAYDSTSSKWINQTASEAGLATSAQGSLADSALQDGDTVSSLTITSADINGGTVDGITSLSVSGTSSLNGAVVINESGADVDFRIESDTNAYAFFLEGSSGNVGIGTSSPSGKLHVQSGNTIFNSAPISNNYVFVGQTASYTSAYGENPLVQISQLRGTSYGNPLALYTWGNDNVAAGLTLGKSRGTAVGTQTIVQNGDALGVISFCGSDGTNMNQVAADITAICAGTPGATADMPGALLFRTTADGAGGPTERMRIDSSGNVGIGTSSPAEKLNVANGNIRASNSSSTASSLLSINNDTSTNGVVIQKWGTAATDTLFGLSRADLSTIWSENTDNFAIGTLGAGPLILGTNNTERMRIDSSGKLLVGTTTGASGASVQASFVNSSGGGIQFGLSTGGGGALVGNSGGGIQFYGYAGNQGSEGYSERMRIDSSGNLLVGTTSPISGNEFTVYGRNSGSALACYTPGANYALALLANGTSYVYFGRGTPGSFTQTGSITNNGSATSYNTTSDYRLKEDWQPMSGSIDRLKNLNPVNFAWKVDGSRVDGFLAHEAQEVVPEAVSGEKDAVEAIGNITDAEGNVVQENVKEPEELAEGQVWTKTEDRPVYQGIDQSKLVPLLTAALQEAVAKIEALETRIAALESN
jgi:hypothetical protein